MKTTEKKKPEPKPKLKQSETVTIKRSLINFAPYNPRKQDKKVIEQLKANFKKVGFMGGIQWNITTGNLIGGHKRLETIDLIMGYDGTAETDYEVKVEQIALDEQTEKEQNIFLNNKRAQGETDFNKLAELLPTINTSAAGLIDYDIKLVESMVPNFNFGSNTDIKKDISALKKTAQEKKDHVKNVKAKFKEDNSEEKIPTHFTVTFRTYQEKAEYLESIGINGDTIFITSEIFFEKSLEN